MCMIYIWIGVQLHLDLSTCGTEHEVLYGNRRYTVLCHTVQANKNSQIVAYQNAVLGCALETKSMLSNIEFLSLERTPYALLSYVLFVEFAHSHNPVLLQRMSKPDIFTCKEHFMLSMSTLDQLNVTSPRTSKHTLM